MNKKAEIIVPVRIEIDATRRMYYNYLHKSEQDKSILIPNSARFNEDTGYINCTQVIEMDSELYDEIMSVNSVTDTESIAHLCDEKGLVFSFFASSGPVHDNAWVGVTVDNGYYRQLIFRDIAQFKSTLTIHSAINAALEDPKNYEKVFHAFDLGERSGMGISFDPFGPYDPDAMNDRICVVFNAGIDQFVALTEFQIEDYQSEREYQTHIIINREAAIDEMISGTGNGEVYYTTIESYARFFTSRYINKHIDMIEPRQIIGKDGLSLLCPTVLSAMYQMLLFCPFNNIKYLKCANAKCNRFFRVDSHHPQTLCKQHMMVRQRKRQNQYLKKKHEILRRLSSH